MWFVTKWSIHYAAAYVGNLVLPEETVNGCSNWKRGGRWESLNNDREKEREHDWG